MSTVAARPARGTVPNVMGDVGCLCHLEETRPYATCVGSTQLFAPRTLLIISSHQHCPSSSCSTWQKLPALLWAWSLGLEVCKGLVTYVDAVRGQTDELESLEQVANSISANL